MQNMIEMFFFFREIFQQNRHFKKCEYFNIFGLKEQKYVYANYDDVAKSKYAHKLVVQKSLLNR